MKIKDVRPQSFVKQIRCDRCDRLTQDGEVEFHETVSIEVTAGYGSIFGDGKKVQIDLCQHCLYLTLGRWLRIVDPLQLERFDPTQHGGEFPTAAETEHSPPKNLSV
ncbi:hypothetical protein [Roseateles albus]|uniref:Uncharacterized protein n=1 Tax=Roseateles albus TaxID=2987525 RepID=A0ABT5KKJ2_9BURK|nr:hypothetical protein [Roseateles albus]MDC8773341.1 hypothetical protein [Roseateles albus]